VEAVRARQAKRFEGVLRPALNARMSPKLMREHCAISETCHNLMKHALDDLHLSARAHDRILKVARTIADLAEADSIGEDHLLEAWLRERLDPCPGIVCTGAAVAFLAGTQAKIPVWADRSGLGWLMRCIYEPKKFIPRYWSALPLVWMVWSGARAARA
jgi:hypothetical protein